MKTIESYVTNHLSNSFKHLHCRQFTHYNRKQEYYRIRSKQKQLKIQSNSKNIISDKKGRKLENNDHQPVGRIRTNHSAISSFKNYNLLLSLFRKYHIKGFRGPQIDTTYEGNFDGLTEQLPLMRKYNMETTQDMSSFYAKFSLYIFQQLK